MTESVTKNPRQWLKTQRQGLLISYNSQLNGHAYLSHVPYLIASDGLPVVRLGRLSQHTENLEGDRKVTLTLLQSEEQSITEHQARISWMAEASPLTPQQITQIEPKYARYFPEESGYSVAMDFEWLSLRPTHLQLTDEIKGQTKLTVESMVKPNPLADIEAALVAEMNDSQRQGLIDCCAHFLDRTVEQVEMLGIDADGVDLKGDGQHLRLESEQSLDTPQQASQWLKRLIATASGDEPSGQHDPECLFCSLPAERILWQDDSCAIISADDEDYPGYLIVIWHGHEKEMTDLTGDDQMCLLSVVSRTEAALRRLLNPDKINLASFGNKVPHIHWHVIPRFADDAHFPEAIWGERQRAAVPRPLTKEKLIAALNEQLTAN